MATDSEFIAPTLIRKFSHAAAGHDGVLRDESGALLIKPCLPREIAFYESAPSHPRFAKWMPTFMGTLRLTPQHPSITSNATTTPASDTPSIPTVLTTTEVGGGGGGGDFAKPAKKPLETSVVISNITCPFKKPCVLDVKLGSQLWDPLDASDDKRERFNKVAAKTTTGSLSMRIAGMKVWKGNDKAPEGKGYEIYDKHYGTTFTADNCIEGFREFLFGGALRKDQSKLLAKRFAEKTAEVLQVLKTEESRMYSASLLYVYEGDEKAYDEVIMWELQRPSKVDYGEDYKSDGDDEDEGQDVSKEEDGFVEDDDEEEEEEKKLEDLKLIDFAHARWAPGEGPDLNSIRGVESAYKLWKELS